MGCDSTEHSERFCHFHKKHHISMVMLTDLEKPCWSFKDQGCEEIYSLQLYGLFPMCSFNFLLSQFLYLKAQPCYALFYLFPILYLNA